MRHQQRLLIYCFAEIIFEGRHMTPHENVMTSYSTDSKRPNGLAYVYSYVYVKIILK